MNKIRAVGMVGRDRVKLNYIYDENVYTIETPRTQWNENLKDGEVVLVQLAVLPVADEHVFDEPTLDERWSDDD